MNFNGSGKSKVKWQNKNGVENTGYFTFKEGCDNTVP